MVATATTTLLFSDLVGSTELHEHLGDAAADEVRQAFFAALRTSVAETGGIEVKNLGDGLKLVAFARSAAEHHGTYRDLHATGDGSDHGGTYRTSTPIQLRVGISAGETSVEDDDWYGTPVNEAARLCSAAAPGSILPRVRCRPLPGESHTACTRSDQRVDTALEGTQSSGGGGDGQWRDGAAWPATEDHTPDEPTEREVGRWCCWGRWSQRRWWRPWRCSSS